MNLTSVNPANNALIDSKGGGDLALADGLKGKKLPDGINLLRGKFLSFKSGRYRMSSVFTESNPLKVLQAIVGLVSVFVIDARIAVGIRQKRHSNQPVDWQISALPLALVKRVKTVALAVLSGLQTLWLHSRSPAGNKRHAIPFAANNVSVFSPRNRFPLFGFFHGKMNDMTATHMTSFNSAFTHLSSRSTW